jgi:chaperonin GroES
MDLVNAMLCATEDKILVVPDEREESTKGGILLPDVSKERPCRGTVISVGPGRHNEWGALIPMPVEVGMKVYYSRWGGNEIKLPDEPLVLVLKPEHVLCVVREEGVEQEGVSVADLQAAGYEVGADLAEEATSAR